MGGYFTIPYAYLTDSNLADDFWTVRLVAKTAAQLAAEKAATVAAAKNWSTVAHPFRGEAFSEAFPMR
jgi:TfoX/Sxy family transcriptional regulator of competence genes